MRKVLELTAILAFGCVLGGRAADWRNARDDAQGSGWQRHETILTPPSVKGLRLIWKLKLDDGAIATPAILGHWVTNRGTKELFFAVSGSGSVYAVDGDLGRLFWRRQLESGRTASPEAPVLGPGPPPPPGKDEVDDDEDVRQEIRPIYVRAAGGKLYRLHPTTGVDLTNASDVPPAGKAASNAALWEDGWVFTAGQAGITGTHGGRRVWTSSAMILPAAPVVANGVVYALSKGPPGRHAVLYAFEAKTGKRLYSSEDLIAGIATSSGLAVANGHIVFGTADGTLYCFGFPVDL